MVILDHVKDIRHYRILMLTTQFAKSIHVNERCDLPLGLYELAIKNGIEKNVKKETGCDVY